MDTPPSAFTPPALPTPCDGPASAADTQPVRGFAEAGEAILRRPARVLHHLQAHAPLGLVGWLTGLGLVAIVAYGVVMGSFSGGVQWWAAPVKLAMGLAVSALICLPSLYVFACLSGSSARWSEILGLITAACALMAVLLVGFAPVAWVFSQSTESLAVMGALHLLFWAVAVAFGLRFLHRAFARECTRAAGLKVWMAIFVLVMVQMTTALRPLLGTADTFLPVEKRFFLVHWGEVLQETAKNLD